MLTVVTGPGLDWLEELRSWSDAQSIWIRTVRQAEEPPYQGLPEIAVQILDQRSRCQSVYRRQSRFQIKHLCSSFPSEPDSESTFRYEWLW